MFINEGKIISIDNTYFVTFSFSDSYAQKLLKIGFK
jgi:hypothetical protein